MPNISVIVTVGIVITSIITIVSVANSTFDDYVGERDQRNLKYALDDCGSLFHEGLELDNCIEKSIRVFGTNEQKQQLMQIHYDP